MARRAEIGNVQLYPNRPLRKSDTNGYVLQFYCPIQGKRVRRRCGTHDRREAKRLQREVRERLINGDYIASGGALTISAANVSIAVTSMFPAQNDMSWEEGVQGYLAQGDIRLRTSSFANVRSRLDICGRILASRDAKQGDPSQLPLTTALTLEGMEFLQRQLLKGAEGRYSSRMPMTVNSIVGEVLTFSRYCSERGWISKPPTVRDLEADEIIRGRPLTPVEFEEMLAAVSEVVGDQPAESWKFLLKLLWESGFRVADALRFHWDDPTRIHPVWRIRPCETSVIVIPSTQKNGKHEEIPMLPGLKALLDQVPTEQRTGNVVGHLWIELAISKLPGGRLRLRAEQLESLIEDYSNSAIARFCRVSEQAVRKWLDQLGLERQEGVRPRPGDIPESVARKIRQSTTGHSRGSRQNRLSRDRVSRIISAIGKHAGIVVCPADRDRGIRIKYASAHDLRRSLAERLFNLNISAETLMVIMRHQDFATTRKFYGAKKSAQSAAREIEEKLVESKNGELVGSFVGRKEKPPELSAEEVIRLKSLLNSL